jgi:arylsulfatase A-like enzyme
MAPWEYTTAELLSDAGYATALYAKWHLGNTQGRLPNDQGFAGSQSKTSAASRTDGATRSPESA